MLSVSEELRSILDELDATFRFVHVGATVGPSKNDETKLVQISQGYVACEVIDNATGEKYHSERGSTEGDAMEKAIRGAITAPKPLTRSQRMTQSNLESLSIKTENESLKNRIAELEAAIAGKKK